MAGIKKRVVEALKYNLLEKSFVKRNPLKLWVFIHMWNKPQTFPIEKLYQ